MKRLFLFILLAISLSASAQVAEVWVGMPDTICPYLTRQQRFYMAQYAMAGNTDTITNVMEGKSVVDSISGNFISLQITPNMHWAMSLTGAPEGSNLPEGKYICLEATVCAPLCATTYRYYDYAWNLLYSRRDPLVIDSEDDVQLF